MGWLPLSLPGFAAAEAAAWTLLRPLTGGVFLGILWQEEDLGLLGSRQVRAKAAQHQPPLTAGSGALPAGCCQHPGPGMQDFPQNGRQLDSLAVCDRVHVVVTDLEEVDHVQASGDLVGQVDQRVAVLSQRALPVLRRALPVKPLWCWGRGESTQKKQRSALFSQLSQAGCSESLILP